MLQETSYIRKLPICSSQVIKTVTIRDRYNIIRRNVEKKTNKNKFFTEIEKETLFLTFIFTLI
jgi:hypothetical protein